MSADKIPPGMIASRVFVSLLGTLVFYMVLTGTTNAPLMPFFYIWIALMIATAIAFVVAAVFEIGVAQRVRRQGDTFMTSNLDPASLLKGMVGLIQLVENRDDVSPALREALLTNHRYVDALAYLDTLSHAGEGEPDFWALHAASGMHIGLWSDRETAERVLKKEPRGTTMTALYRADKRPANCRNRLRDEGKAYPRSGCAVCRTGGMTGCPHDRLAPTQGKDEG